MMPLQRSFGICETKSPKKRNEHCGTAVPTVSEAKRGQVSFSKRDLTPFVFSTDQCKIDGKVVDYESWPLHRSDWVEQAKEGNQLIVRIYGKSLEYDFANWTRVERHSGP